MPAATRAPVISAIRRAARSTARRGRWCPIPFSWRMLASERRPRRRAVLRIVGPWKIADSRITRVVPALTSVLAPPMIPASPIARSASAITSIRASSVRCSWSIVSSTSPARPRRTTILPSGHRIGVIRVHRLAKLVHDVVGDVHHRADRAHPGRQQAALHPGRRGAVADPLEPARREARAALGVLDHHADVVAHRQAGILADRCRPASGPMSPPGRRPRGPGRPSRGRRRGSA